MEFAFAAQMVQMVQAKFSLVSKMKGWSLGLYAVPNQCVAHLMSLCWTRILSGTLLAAVERASCLYSVPPLPSPRRAFAVPSLQGSAAASFEFSSQATRPDEVPYCMLGRTASAPSALLHMQLAAIPEYSATDPEVRPYSRWLSPGRALRPYTETS